MEITADIVNNITADELIYKGYYPFKENDKDLIFEQTLCHAFFYKNYYIRIRCSKHDLKSEYKLKHIIFFEKENIAIHFYKTSFTDTFITVNNFINIINDIMLKDGFKSPEDEFELYKEKIKKEL